MHNRHELDRDRQSLSPEQPARSAADVGDRAIEQQQPTGLWQHRQPGCRIACRRLAVEESAKIKHTAKITL